MKSILARLTEVISNPSIQKTNNSVIFISKKRIDESEKIPNRIYGIFSFFQKTIFQNEQKILNWEK